MSCCVALWKESLEFRLLALEWNHLATRKTVFSGDPTPKWCSFFLCLTDCSPRQPGRHVTGGFSSLYEVCGDIIASVSHIKRGWPGIKRALWYLFHEVTMLPPLNLPMSWYSAALPIKPRSVNLYFSNIYLFNFSYLNIIKMWGASLQLFSIILL